MQVTIKHVAQRAGVSDTAVSLAFQENSRISPATRDKILRAARELNYAPNTAARNLRAGKTGTIGFLVNDITNPFYALMLKEAERALEPLGYEMFSAGSDWNLQREVRLVERMAQSRVEGMIICLCEQGAQSLEILDRYAIPHVAVDSYPDFYQGPFIANDLRACGELVARHFCETHRRAPAFVDADAAMGGFSAFRKIRDGYVQTLQALGLEWDEKNHIEAGLTIEAGRDAFALARRRGLAADAYFCANDLCALGFLEAAREAGICVGPEVAVVGVDDLDVSSLAQISLTSVRQPYARIAREAVAALVDILDGQADMPRRELPPQLIVRNSSRNKE